MDAVFIQPALVEDKLTAAPKKARKLMFTDPFIFHSAAIIQHDSNSPFSAMCLDQAFVLRAFL
jgi:hypothetical protein